MTSPIERVRDGTHSRTPTGLTDASWHAIPLCDPSDSRPGVFSARGLVETN